MQADGLYADSVAECVGWTDVVVYDQAKISFHLCQMSSFLFNHAFSGSLMPPLVIT